ncbi:MAG: hypothetical protein SH809_20255 [Rhodothermales bacterium]|nr:hypothetical protein [Rhodothermales bacterium]
MRTATPVPWIGWFVLVITLLSGGLMIVEGIHMLSQGRPLLMGVWAEWVAAAGLDPQSPTVGFIFIGYGAVLLWLTFAFLRRFSWGRVALTVALVAGLWYAPIGTTLNVIALVMVYLTPLRDWYAGKEPAHTRPV